MLLTIIALSLLLSLCPTVVSPENNIDTHMHLLKKIIKYSDEKQNFKKKGLQGNRRQQNKKMHLKHNKQTQPNYAYSSFKNPSIFKNDDQIIEIIQELETKKIQPDLLFDGLSQVCDIMSTQTEKKRKRRFFNILGLILRVVAQMTKK